MPRMAEEAGMEEAEEAGSRWKPEYAEHFIAIQLSEWTEACGRAPGLRRCGRVAGCGGPGGVLDEAAVSLIRV